MGYYYKSSDIKFSSYACVKHITNTSSNEIKLFNNCIKIITSNDRHFTENVIDDFDTYFFGILIHRHLNKNAYDIYCSSKSYAYFVIKYLHKFSHDDYNRIYTTLYNKFDEIQKLIASMPIEEKIEFMTNFERNFRIEMINNLSEVIDSAFAKSENRQNDIYVSVLMREIVNVIIKAQAQEYFTDVQSKHFLEFMNLYELSTKNAKSYETEFINDFFDFIAEYYNIDEDLEKKIKKLIVKKGFNGNIKHKIENDEHIFTFPDASSSEVASYIMAMKPSLKKYDYCFNNPILKIPTLMKRIKNKVKETVIPENISKKAIAIILQSESEKIKNTLAYLNFDITDYRKLDIGYNVDYIPMIESILKHFTIPFIGEMNLNLVHHEFKFYKNLERDVPSRFNN